MKPPYALLCLGFVLLLGCTEAPAPTPEAPAPVAEAPALSPYAGMEDRPIKSLDAAALTAYQTGAGMGLAMAAELNHYPGPKHVLELADSLHLTPVQRTAVQQSFDAMHQQAVALGEDIIAQEARLDSLFATAVATPETVRETLGTLGTLQAALRFVHLNAHLEMKGVLRPEQVQHYVALRGYGTGHSMDHQNHKM